VERSEPEMPLETLSKHRREAKLEWISKLG
jgi:hypothetical protein